jgi:hypothetical protein
MLQAYHSFCCCNFSTNCSPVGCITLICFDECGVSPENAAAAAAASGSSISYCSEQMFLVVENEACYSLPIQ